MAELSPAARAVYDAYLAHWTADPYEVSPEALVAALRTAAAQLTPYAVSEMEGAAFARNKIGRAHV